MIDTDKFREFAQRRDWLSLYAMLDDAKTRAVTAEDRCSELHWRIFALEMQQRYAEALALLRSNAELYNSQSYIKHRSARILSELGRDHDALAELSDAPIEAELATFYGLAIDAKFFLFYLMAKTGDKTIKQRLKEIPHDYRYISRSGISLSTQCIADLLIIPL